MWKKILVLAGTALAGVVVGVIGDCTVTKCKKTKKTKEAEKPAEE